MRSTRSFLRSLAVTATAVAAFAVPLLQTPAAQAAWLGKRGVIAFTGHLGGSPKSSVWFVGRDGKDLVEMTPNDRRNDVDATFSPEGGPHVAYAGKPLGGGDADLYVIDRYPPGGGLPKPDNITDDLDGDAEHPAFSPSGGKIAFDLTQDGKPTRIWTSNLVGTKKSLLTCCRAHSGYPLDQPIDGRNPSWSPDSTTIAFVAPDPSNPTVDGIWLASYDQRKPPVFLTDGDLPNWSPLQDKIVYVLGSNLMVANPTPSNPDPQAITREPKGVSDTNPAWTPDSDHTGGWAQNPGTVLFERAGRVYTIGAGPANGPKTPHAITSTRFVASNADWQPKCSNNKPKNGGVIRGTDGPDLLCGGAGDDVIYGNGGDDRIYAGAGHDVVYAGAGNDFVLGGVGEAGDVIDGGPGNDHLEGGTGPDKITDSGKDSGNDSISAGDANDDIVAWDGTLGNDKVDGGDGFDVCVVDNTDLGHVNGVDFIWGCDQAKLPLRIQRLEAQPAPSSG
jgi:RTX calcium-binding nonapeptide repeat (4 copies)/WD40-like Beta Propeller Repeat